MQIAIIDACAASAGYSVECSDRVSRAGGVRRAVQQEEPQERGCAVQPRVWHERQREAGDREGQEPER